MAGRKGEKHWRDALRVAVNDAREGAPAGRTKLREIAEKVVELALDGDMQAIKEIGDRMDGKAIQGVDLEVDVSDPVKELLEHVAKNGQRLT